MLPTHRKALKKAQEVQSQTKLDPHLKEKEKEKVVRYTDELFQSAALEWLVATDQV